MLPTSPGTIFYAKFEDEDLWHQRLVLRRTDEGNYILSPDGDMYEEKWSDYDEVVG